MLIELYNLTETLYSDSEDDIYFEDDDTYQEFIFTRLSSLVIQSYNGPGTAEGINFYEFVTECDGFMCQFRIKELFDNLDEIKDENSELKDYLTKSLDAVKLRKNNEKALEIIINQESYVDTAVWQGLEEKYKFSTLLKSVGSSLIPYDDCKDVGEEMLELSEHTIPGEYLSQVNIKGSDINEMEEGNKIKEAFKRVIEKAEKLDWTVTNAGDNYYKLSKNSPSGQHLSIVIKGKNSYEFIESIWGTYLDLIQSPETYLRIDDERHRINGVNDDMKDIYKEFEQMLDNLYDELVDAADDY